MALLWPSGLEDAGWTASVQAGPLLRPGACMHACCIWLHISIDSAHAVSPCNHASACADLTAHPVRQLVLGAVVLVLGGVAHPVEEAMGLPAGTALLLLLVPRQRGCEPARTGQLSDGWYFGSTRRSAPDFSVKRGDARETHMGIHSRLAPRFSSSQPDRGAVDLRHADVGLQAGNGLQAGDQSSVQSRVQRLL